jgi:short-subunit dehydrogenase involved in D-alanine esterification of teichoic acids
MAKRKTPKVKDLRSDKISEEQLSKMQNVVRAINKGQQQLGVLESQKHSLLHDVMQLQGVIGKIQQELKEEYGNIDVNINDGTIKYKEDEQADS